MALLRKNDLIRRGVDALEQATDDADAGNLMDAEVQTRIALGYAKLAVALDQAAISDTITKVGSW